jgi:hypothetical protein
MRLYVWGAAFRRTVKEDPKKEDPGEKSHEALSPPA